MSRARIEFNRVVVGIGLLIGLPAVAISERVHDGSGRALAVRLVGVFAALCGVRFRVHGTEQLENDFGYVFVANHASPLDIAAILAARPDVAFLAAADLYRVPLLAWAMRALDTVPIDRRDPVAARQQLAALAAGSSSLCLAVFPQGGIVAAGEHRRFKSGAFALSIAAGASVVPVAIRGAAQVLPPRARLAVRPGTVRVDILAPIPTGGLTADDRVALRGEAEAAVLRCLASAA